MEAERLHSVVLTVLAEYEANTIPRLLKAVVNGLEAANAAGTTTAQAEQFLQARDALYGALEYCNSNNFTPSRMRILEAMGAARLTGTGLRQEVERILSENQLTPGNAVKELQVLVLDTGLLATTLTGARDAFARFNVKTSDSIEDDVCEVGALLPVSIVGDSIKSFGEGLEELDANLRPFAELVGADAASWKVRSVSAGSLEVFSAQNLAVAVVLAKAIEWAQERYKAFLEVKLLRKQLEETKTITDPTLKKIEGDAQASLKTEIRAYAEILVSEHYQGDQRGKNGNEMRALIAKSLRYIEDCVDHNGVFEVTPPQAQPQPAAGEEEDETARVRRESINLIEDKGSTMRLLPPRIAPILALPAPEDLYEDEKPEKKK